MEITEKLEFIGKHDPEGAERLKRLLGKKETLKEGNVYGERFTDRQFHLVFGPLLESAFERARILEILGKEGMTVGQLSKTLEMSKEIVFRHMKEMVKKNLVEMGDHQDRETVFRRK
jgi:hypothetical protein